MNWELRVHKRLPQGRGHFELDLDIQAAAPRLALFGPSGSGKSQTLKMIAGVQRPDRGRIAVAGELLFDAEASLSLAPQQRGLGCVFQDHALFPHLSLRQNIAFSRVRGWRNPARRFHDPLVEQWIARFGLQAVADQCPLEVSGGQRQRAALARALVSSPRALLLDEPFAALDQALRRSLRAELAELQAQLKIPLLLITHDEDDVKALADQVVTLDQGRVASITELE
ncbi:ATP-binding cassette domain-containing protein [Pelomonas sp. SE-A7]|uniref:ATP-binding cassette domain-containing protein n=1 Tax=Pelomonas sp. SE-A7 TaxID=3054953 RepID=UPI00259CF8FE|nr:ATP-binding cassette domain-containing protein [Pelomonas sp. SE-A7]MDM4768505.1 ATP-binding cassette domain-containing protein [Pelomonas sp. SE-A7]